MAMLSRELRNAVAGATDSVFVAALISGVTPTASAGSDADGIAEDLATLLDAVATSSASRLFLLAAPAVVKSLAVKSGVVGFAFPKVGVNGGEIVPGLTVVSTDALTGSSNVVLVDATGIAAGSDTVTLDGAGEATLQMGSGGELLSLWQNNLHGIRAERWFSFEKLRADAVAALSGVAW